MSVQVDDQILVWALRYAIGRQTYAPHDVIWAIEANLPVLSARMRANLADEIRRAALDQGLGDPKIDEPEWLRLLGTLEGPDAD